MSLRNRAFPKWLFLLSGVVLVRLAANYPNFVEKYYSLGIYPATSSVQRAVTGWLPFSLGDLLYILAGIWLLQWLVKGVAAVRHHRFSPANVISTIISITLSIYIIFNVLWGLNYNRISAATGAGLSVDEGTEKAVLDTVTTLLLDKTNRYRPLTATGFEASRKEAAQLFSTSFAPGVKPISMKPSLFGKLGNYMGYSGYYNPISGEAQVNTYVPEFLIPFVACHEMAHQAGWAKENEANFIGFMAARNSADSSMLYSAYFNMFLYANAQLRQVDSLRSRKNYDLLSPGVKADLAVYRNYLRKYDSPLGTAVDVFYNQYLKWNQQPAGQMTYNRVVLWLLAYYRKNGVI